MSNRAGRIRTVDLLTPSQAEAAVSGEALSTCNAERPSGSNQDSSSVVEPSEVAPDLRRLIEAWPRLPDRVRADIVAMIEATAGA